MIKLGMFLTVRHVEQHVQEEGEVTSTGESLLCTDLSQTT